MSRGFIADLRAEEFAEIDRLSRSIVTGALSYEEYKAKCAAIKAHKTSLDLIERVAKKYFDDDEAVDNLGEGEE